MATCENCGRTTKRLYCGACASCDPDEMAYQTDFDAQFDAEVNNDDFTAAFNQDIQDIEREIRLHNRR